VPLSLGGATDFSFDLLYHGTVYAAKDGVYKSVDGGLTWERLNAPAATRLQVSRTDHNHILAANTSGQFGGISISLDGGASWTTRSFSAPYAHDYVGGFDIDPANPNNIYVYIGGDDWIGQYKTSSGGIAWEQFHYEPNMSVYTSALKVYASDPRYVFASSYVGFYRSSDSGNTWELRGHPGSMNAVEIDPRERTRLFALGVSGGVRRSVDEGNSWFPFNEGLPVAARDLEIDGAGAFLFATSEEGIYRVSLRPLLSVSGRATTPAGSGLRNALITVTDSAGNIRSALTSTLGFYSFGDIRAGEIITVSASSRRYRFQPLALTVNESLSELDLVALE
jgi:hypothetical protein